MATHTDDGGDRSPAPAGFSIVGVGASAGGVEAFNELLRHVPSGAGMAFVLIQHLDPSHASYLGETLARSTTLPVLEAQDRMRVEPGHVYVIPSHADVGILKGTLVLFPRSASERKPHLPIDFFFEALAADQGSRAIGVVLSGTGSDGAEGLRAIRAEVGVTFAQDPRTAKFAGMPEAAVRIGVDFCLPIPELAREVVRFAGHPFLGEREARLAAPENDGELSKVLLLVRGASGLDFSEYKRASIRRRLARRMALCRSGTLEEYARLLREDPSEVKALLDDLLIHVTSFFRDPVAFDKLAERAFPEILARKRDGAAIRIWCAGCSTGEEPYSLLIALHEFLMKQRVSDIPVQLFGTDISEKAIEIARAGVYSDGIARDVGPERLARYFTRLEGGGYRITKTIRDRCAFVKHDLGRDPPFSRLDLVLCRNVLIYFGRELQKRALATFHFALNEPGFLLLGRAEGIADGPDLFREVDKEAKLLARTAAKSTLRLAPARSASPMAPLLTEARAPGPDVIRQAESLLLEQWVPPGVIVNGRLEILHFRGRTGPWLEPAPGAPQLDLLKMARRGLAADLRIAVSQARKERRTVRRAAARIEEDGSSRACALTVIPIALPPESREEAFAVLFEEDAPTAVPPPGSDAGQVAPPRSSLEDELATTKEYLRSLAEEHQRASEELLSANEELVSSNEALQSLNEELQTAREELQSTNEELTTLNDELHARNAELSSVNSDLVNVLASVEIPIVILDGQRRIRRFTPKARPILNLLPSDVGRPIGDIKPNLEIEGLDRKITDVIETVAVHEEDVRGKAGRWFRLQIRPYTTVDRKVDGAVVSVVDIDALKRALGAAEWARDYAQATVEALQIPLLLLDEQVRVSSANRAFEERYGIAREAVAGRSMHDFMDGALDLPEVQAALEGVRARGESVQGLELGCELPRLGRRSLSLSARSVETPEQGLLILLAVEDVTDRRQAELERAKLLQETEAAKASAEAANRTKDLFLATVSHELRTPLSSLLLSAQRLRMGKVDQAKLDKTLETIERAAKAQAQLIDDLLDISRIVTGKLKMELQLVSLAAVALAAADSVAATAEKKQIDLWLRLDDTLAPVSGDPMRLQQVAENLLTNAIKFTQQKGRVSVEVDAVDGNAQLRVSDSGVGIEPDFLPRIFSYFSQEERGQTRKHGGLGLGLAIVHHVVEAHAGTVLAESPGKGKGATFTVSLPLMHKTESRRPGEPPAEDAVGDIQGARVLVVEDDPATREALTEMLALSGAEVTAAESAAQAFELFQSFRPEVLVCDIGMPDEDGYGLLGRLRALGSSLGGDVPALALTAFAGEEDRRKAGAAGFQAHMAKPVDIDRLVSTLSRLWRAAGPSLPARARPEKLSTHD